MNKQSNKKKMKGKKKDSSIVEIAMHVFKTDYAPLLALMKEQKEMIDAMPEGKERNFLQRDYDEYAKLTDNHIGFKGGLMLRMGIEADPISYVFSKEKLDEMYQKLKDIPFDAADNDAMPTER